MDTQCTNISPDSRNSDARATVQPRGLGATMKLRIGDRWSVEFLLSGTRASAVPGRRSSTACLTNVSDKKRGLGKFHQSAAGYTGVDLLNQLSLLMLSAITTAVKMDPQEKTI